ncbi:bromodomain and WD repeat-containing protein 3-like protein [Carex littledalei]|uniref:Bromodomain and WD repeat-containing protein 3-like protein n=1 Tax=Carex littledalei TaxID=544730 RepID=A0A833QNF9_9POAL|nr:bromodomain and WD repeat-containing protein 3-like protein [Carex littledalei]
MALRKHNSEDTTSLDMGSLNFKIPKRDVGREPNPNPNPGPNVDIDMREVYFMIMHLLSSGPCKQSFTQLSNELREHQLLPRRYHAWFSRNGEPSGIEDDDGISLPLCYTNLTDRYPHIGRDHLIKLLKQLIQSSSAPLNGLVGGPTCNAADVPTLLGSGSFSLLASDRYKEEKEAIKLPGHLRWPHMHADQIRGLSLREIGGGFAKHHRAPSVRAACYAIAKPSTLVQKMQIIKKLRGHQNAVYCATFDRSGRFVITGSDDRLVKIWSMETALCLSSCRGHEGDITDLAVSSNNTLVASSSNDCIIRVWRLPDGVPISVLKGHTSAVTAIAFSPRPSAVYQLLSSSDDGTCRIWDARYSQQSLHVYVPKPPENPTVKIGEPSTSSTMPPIQQTHQILCCAFNANGTVFVTGSSDTYARVWNACRFATEESSEPIHEMDLLSGHENDVNYVQFSGCAAPSRSLSGEIAKEDNLPKFKNSWFTHDNIVTCSRDGSAIIWVPRSRRSHGKVGRWTRAYHLKVPPPPMASQPTRGGPRQRFQPTPRGVNMIVWSLDNRFVLAAIMDCRICVWNASDGSLVHSLIGHKASTFVLDVHPFNPRIAMSAGYDGKTIIWDIWEGKPVQIYETGQFKLVDGKFSPDGTSIILSDEVGQIFIIATGQGESQKDAKYDQFFLGDYRPLARDANGNMLDQETQLQPYRRNIQDLLCDSTMIPYPEPYQSMYQRRRLGTLGIEWRPPSVNFAVGPTYNATTGEFQMLPVIDLERWAEPLPEIADVFDWEQQVVEGQTDEDLSDSEYNLTDEYESEGEEQEILSINSSDESEYSDDVDAGVANPSAGKAGLRRSRRKNHKSEAELVTSSGRRVKRRNLEEPEEPVAVGQSRAHKTRKSKHVGRVRPRKKSPKSRELRPQRRAARNALSLFSKITGASSDAEEDEEEGEEDSESSYSESDSMIPELKGKESQSSSMLSYELKKHVQEREGYTQNGGTTSQTRRRLILKLPHRNSNVVNALETVKAESLKNEVASTSAVITEPKQEAQPEPKEESKTELGPELESKPEGELNYDEFAMAEAEPQTGRSSCGTESEEPGTPLVAHSSKIRWGKVNQRSSSKRPKVPEDSGPTDENKPAAETITSTNVEESRGIDEDMESKAVQHGGLSIGTQHQAGSSSQPIIYKRLKVKAHGLGNERSKIEDEVANAQHDIASIKIDNRLSEETGVEADSKVPVVYTRSRPSKKRKPDDNEYNIEESTSNSNHSRDDADYDAAADEGSHHGTRLRERSLRSRHNNTYYEASTSGRRSHSERQARMGSNDWTSPSKSGINLRPARNRREVSGYIEPRQFDRRNQPARKLSWLMLLEHEESYRYIPQKGDDVAYLRQGHEEYIEKLRRSNEKIPSDTVPDLKAVEFCKVRSLEYSTFMGSGEGCCKLTLEFTDPDSSAFRMVFKVTLPELVTFPDFLVERTRYETSINRNWTHRDKCLVWWRNEDGESGSWWEGRIMAVKPKSPKFPNSPWERYVIQYKNDASGQHSHSPWELQDVDGQWAHPHIDNGTRDRLLSVISELEQASMRKDSYGIQKINMVVQKAEFINRFPVQISIEVIKSRLENNYYRTVEAVKNDASTMVSIAESYFPKIGDLANRIHRLKEWIENIFSAL